MPNETAKLRAQLRGPLIEPGDPSYDGARKVHNGMIDKHPRLIARCTDTADVMAAVTIWTRSRSACIHSRRWAQCGWNGRL